MEDRRPAANCDPYKALLPHSRTRYLGKGMVTTVVTTWVCDWYLMHKEKGDKKNILHKMVGCFMVIFIPCNPNRYKIALNKSKKGREPYP